jgi:hypothetical protein
MTTPASDAPTQKSSLTNLEELTNAHRELLKRSDTIGDGKSLNASILQFLEAGVALGSRLSVPRQRAEVQRLLDYWSSSLSPEALEGSPDVRSRRFILAPCIVSDQPEIAAAARKVMDDFSPEQKKVAQRIIVRLLKLEADSASFSPISRSAEELKFGLNEKIVSEVIRQFVNCGLLEEGGNKLSLSSTTVMGFWPEAREWLADRRRLRGAAQFWKGSGDAGTLLEKGDALEEARSYLDLNEIEEAFVQASLQKGVEREHRRKKITGSWLIGLSVTSIGLAVCAVWALREMRNAQTARGEAEAFNTKLIAERIVVKKQNEDIAGLNANLKRQNNDIAGLNANLKRQNNELRAQASDSKQRSERARAQLENLLSAIQDLANKPGITNNQKTALIGLGDQIGIRLDSPAAVNVSSSAGPLEPGLGLKITNGKQSLYGTMGILVRKEGSNRPYFLGPRYLFNLPDGGDVFRISRLGETPGKGDLIAHFDPAASGIDEKTELAPIELADGLEVRNAVPSVGLLSGVVSVNDLVTGTEVVLAGPGSGTKRGKIRRIDADQGIIFTDRISTAGDAGAPVSTPDGKAVGILVASNGEDESQIALLSAYLNKHTDFQFLLPPTTPDATSIFNGAIVQFIVSEKQAAQIPSLKAVIPEFRRLGVRIPDDGILKRKRTPPITTEVRFYHGEDEKLAKAVQGELFTFLGVQARISRVIDDNVPLKMIQISFSDPDLEKAVDFLKAKSSSGSSPSVQKYL